MNAAQVYDTSADAAEKSIASELVVVSMLVKPDSTDNLIDIKSEDVIPVAILTTSTLSGDAADFDATQVDTLSVLCGPNRSTAVLTSGQIVDVDMDGDFDLMLNFPSMNAGFSCGDSRAVITGKTFTKTVFYRYCPHRSTLLYKCHNSW